MSGANLFLDILGAAERRASADIFVVGTGMACPEQLTQEAAAALRRCRVVYTLLGDGLDTLDGWTGRVESVSHLYRPGRWRPDIYQEVVETVLDATDRERPVGYLAGGNPAIFDYICSQIRDQGRARGLHVRTIAGVSSLDTVLLDLEHDIGHSGLQIYEASWFVRHRIEPRVDVPLLLMQPSAFGTNFATLGHAPTPRALEPLRHYLERFYPPAHPLVLVRSSGAWFEDPQIHRAPLADVCEVGLEILRGTSLYIPPLRPPADDETFGKLTADPSHFADAYRPAR
ncbi:MAG: SAM-dependent methyltransferase [Chloroflexota bacterium]